MPHSTRKEPPLELTYVEPLAPGQAIVAGVAVAVAEVLDPDCVEVLDAEEDADEAELELEPELLVTSRPPQMLGELTAAPTEDFR